MDYCVVLFSSGIEILEETEVDTVGLVTEFTGSHDQCQSYVAEHEDEIVPFLGNQIVVFNV